MLDIQQYDPHSPKCIGDIVGNREVWTTLAEMIRTNGAPNIVLSGPAGCGKSMFLRLVLGGAVHPVLVIDCTANSGLRDVRSNIRGFARGSRTNAGDMRWVILEHADSLTADTQAFLRRMMETTAANARFMFECTDAGAIAEPILSRSTLFTVNRPDDTEVRYELMRRTDFTLDTDDVEMLCARARGNLRAGLLAALALRWTDVLRPKDAAAIYKELLAKRPTSAKADWVTWAIEAERVCRSEGLDMRELMERGWPNNYHVAYMRQQWSRLGGVSTRALFYRCVGYCGENAVKCAT